MTQPKTPQQMLDQAREEFIRKCFDANDESPLCITGIKAKFIANWWLSKLQSLIEAEKAREEKEIEHIKKHSNYSEIFSGNYAYGMVGAKEETIKHFQELLVTLKL